MATATGSRSGDESRDTFWYIGVPLPGFRWFASSWLLSLTMQSWFWGPGPEEISRLNLANIKVSKVPEGVSLWDSGNRRPKAPKKVLPLSSHLYLQVGSQAHPWLTFPQGKKDQVEKQSLLSQNSFYPDWRDHLVEISAIYCSDTGKEHKFLASDRSGFESQLCH